MYLKGLLETSTHTRTKILALFVAQQLRSRAKFQAETQANFCHLNWVPELLKELHKPAQPRAVAVVAPTGVGHLWHRVEVWLHPWSTCAGHEDLNIDDGHDNNPRHLCRHTLCPADRDFLAMHPCTIALGTHCFVFVLVLS